MVLDSGLSTHCNINVDRATGGCDAAIKLPDIAFKQVLYCFVNVYMTYTCLVEKERARE